MTSSIAFVGAGPTTVYTLHALLDQASRQPSRPVSITIFEAQASIGRGTPYRPGWNDPAMLANIGSIEIPPLEQSLVEWLSALPSHRLAALGIGPEEIDERAFYPRLALGEYFHDQFLAILARAKARGVQVTVRTQCRVIDAVSESDGMTLTVRPRTGDAFQERFDHVVLATGHQWPAHPEVRPGYFLSPWPASALAEIPPCDVGIRGTSLTAIDATVALAATHGAFIEDADGTLGYQPAAGTDAFHITMMSRKGLLPEADFYAPLPYEPLSVCTAEAIETLIRESDADLLDRCFELFKRELLAADPAYAAKTGLASLGLEEFCDRYFADRAAADPFEWAEQNLKEARRNHEAEFTVAWRYAILRMHEVVALLIPHLEQGDFQRFTRFFKPVFVDDYATVPHESIRRMLALHRAAKLDIVAIGDDYRIDSHRPEGGAVVLVDGERRAFPVFIEATGQKPLAAKDFPFPSLLRQRIIRDTAEPDGAGCLRGIVIDDQFHPVADEIPADQLFCLSLPFLLGRHPFSQGITSSHAMGQVVGGQLAAVMEREAEEVPDADRSAVAA
jgi:uncharacterized NAD(P)/FAD-binding protein YdhS